MRQKHSTVKAEHLNGSMRKADELTYCLPALFVFLREGIKCHIVKVSLQSKC